MHLARDWCHGKQRVSPFFYDLGLEVVGLKGNFTTVEQLVPLVVKQLISGPNSFIQSCQRDLWRRPRWRIYLFVNDFSRFHPNYFRNTISRECFVKNDSVRSCLLKLLVLMFLPCFMHVLCMTRCIQGDRYRILMVFVHKALLFLPLPACRQINEGNTRSVSEDRLWFSRTELLHHLIDAHVVHVEKDESISLTPHNHRLNVLLTQHRSKHFHQKYSSIWWIDGFLSTWFGFDLWSACKITRIQFQRIFFELHFSNFLLMVVQIYHKLVWFMTISDPGVIIVSVESNNSDLNSIFTVQNLWAQFWCPVFWLWCFFVPWQSVFTTSGCTELWEFCIVM